MKPFCVFLAPVLRCCYTVEGCPERATVTATVWPFSRTKTTLHLTSHHESLTSSLSTAQSRRKVTNWPTSVMCIFGCLTSVNASFLFLPLIPTEFDDPSALVVLLEEELVVIDLQTPGWPSLPTPYLAPLHSSAITCSCHISSVPPKLWERVVNAGKAQQGLQHTHRVRGRVRSAVLN